MIEFTKSLFYQVNFLPPVRPSQDQLEAWHTQSSDVTNFIHAQFKDGEPLRAFSSPLTLNPQRFEAIGRAFTGKDWRILSEKPVQGIGGLEFKQYYSVLEHGGLPGKVVKHAGKRKPDGYVAGGAPIQLSGDFFDVGPYCSLLRIAMADRIRQIVAQNPNELDGITLPRKELCEIQSGRLQDQTLPIDQRFLIVAEKVDCLSFKDTVDAIDQMSKEEQEALADKLVKLVTKTGLADASFSNVRLGKEGDVTEKGSRRIYLIDTEPSNVMILDQGWFKNLFAFQSSLEQAGRIGTIFLRYLEIKNWINDNRAPHFVVRIKEHIEAQKSNKYSPTKIGFYLISVVALTAIYKKNYFGERLKPYFEKYAESAPYKAVSSLKIGRKTYIVAVLSPLEVGLAKMLGYCGGAITFAVKNQIIMQSPGTSQEEKTEQALKNPWMQRAARIQGQGRMIATEEQLIQQMRMMGQL